MKTCKICNRVWPDEYLFCPIDGNKLSIFTDEDNKKFEVAAMILTKNQEDIKEMTKQGIKFSEGI